jgi:Ca-activated chloride channel family protein
MFLTDMIPTSGDTNGDDSLVEMTRKNADSKIYTTFIGVGVDFNTNLVSLLSSIRATNYMSVKSSKDFKKQLDEEFDYLVTPHVFNSAVDIDGDGEEGWQAVRVFGSPGHEIPSKGRLVFSDSCFPSAKEGGDMTKGGVVVVKLEKKPAGTSSLKFRTSYEDKHGKKFVESSEFNMPTEKTEDKDHFENVSARKAVLLVRYVNFMKHFLRAAAAREQSDKEVVSISTDVGIPVPDLLPKGSSQSSKQTVRKKLDPSWHDLFKKFIDHFEQEMEIIQDNQLDRELQQLLTIYQTE